MRRALIVGLLVGVIYAVLYATHVQAGIGECSPWFAKHHPSMRAFCRAK